MDVGREPGAPLTGRRLGIRAIVAIVVAVAVISALIGALAGALAVLALQGDEAADRATPTPTRTQTTAASPSLSGTPSSVLASGLTVTLPAGWTVRSQSDDRTSINIDNGLGDAAYLKEAKYEAGTSANAIAAAAGRAWISESDTHSHAKVREPVAMDLPDFSGDVSVVEYTSDFLSNGSRRRVTGMIYGAMKPDGSALFVWLSSTPEDWKAREDEFALIVAGALAQFAGTSPAPSPSGLTASPSLPGGE